MAEPSPISHRNGSPASGDFPRLTIPSAGSTFDQAGAGGWISSAIPQASTERGQTHSDGSVLRYQNQVRSAPPPIRSSSSTSVGASSHRIALPPAYTPNHSSEATNQGYTLPIGRTPCPSPMYRPTPNPNSRPKLALAPLSSPNASATPPPVNPSSLRSKPTPSLSLAIPRLGIATAGLGAGAGPNGGSPDRDGAGETSYYGGPRTPLARYMSENGGDGGETEYLTNRQETRSVGADRTVTSLPAELRQALSQMRIGGSTPGRQSSADRSGSSRVQIHGQQSDSRRPSFDVDNFGFSTPATGKVGGCESAGGSGNVTPRSGLSRHSSVTSNAGSRGRGPRAGDPMDPRRRSGSSGEYGAEHRDDAFENGSQEQQGLSGREELDPADYETLERLGEGAGGAVEKVRDRKTGAVMAMKVIPTSPNPAIHKQILRELQFLNDCQSPYIVDHFGSFLTSQDTCIGILMEFCEAGSLDSLVRRVKKLRARTSEKVLGRIAESVLRGLDYLHERRIIHRDIKPSNILVTKSGQVKLCDFGVSGELVNSMAGTFTGTSFYMAPERIQGMAYSIKSDVWSLGLTLHEVAHNRFPFPPEGEAPLSGPIELLNFIVAQPVPRMIDSPAERIVWTARAQDFMSKCLIRDANERPYPRDLLKHPWIVESAQRNINMAKWVAAICQF